MTSDKIRPIFADDPALIETIERLRKGGGDGGDDMRERVAKLEAGQEAIRREMDQRFNNVDRALGEIKDSISKLPNEWAMAKVVFFVIGGLMAAALFGPRLLSMLPT